MKKVLAIALGLGMFSGVYAADNTDVTITVNEGVLDVDITDDVGNAVATPGVAMTAVTTAFADTTSTGTLGVTGERIAAYNPRTNGAFTVSIQSSDTEWLGATGQDPAVTGIGGSCNAGQTWVDRDADTGVDGTGGAVGFDGPNECFYNMGFAGTVAPGTATLTVDPATAGLVEQATPDPDQLPNPWSGLTARGVAGAPDNGLSLGASTTFALTSSVITLLTSTDVADEGNDQAILTLTGVDLEQVVPAAQPADAGGYSLNLLLTIA